MSDLNETVDRVAQAMRHAFNKHDEGRAPVPWDQADEERREAWRVCARAAIKTLAA